MPDNWVPEIMYEENSDGASSQIPFIAVPEDEIMPKLLYVFESRDTGTYEPGMDGEEVPVVQWDLHQYADMLVLKENLSAETFDLVREALELEPMKIAAQKGQTISNNVRTKVLTDSK